MNTTQLLLLLGFLLPGCAIQESVSGPSFPDQVSWDISIPVAGNAWVLDDPAASEGMVRENGLINWSDPAQRVGVFFHLAGTGEIRIALRARVQSGESLLKCTFGGETQEINLSNAEWAIIPVGTFEVTLPGYQRLELQGNTHTGPDFGEVEAILLTGAATKEAIHFVQDEFYWGRRGPSVHLWYPQADVIRQVEWFYNEITVPEGQDVLGSYFMANGFGEGYFGFQVNSDTERRILFSVWSPYPTDNPNDIPEDKKIILLKKGSNVYTGAFGNEGSGGQSYLLYPWRAGITYRFLLRGHPASGGSTEYTAWFFAPEVGQWQLIAGWRRPQTNTYLRGLYSFLENFIPETGVISRSALYSNQWVRDTRGQWHELTRARFTADDTARKGNRLDYTGGMQNGAFFLRNCGFFNERTEIDSDFERPANGKQPSVDLDGLP